MIPLKDCLENYLKKLAEKLQLIFQFKMDRY